MLREQLDVPDMVVLVLPALMAVVQHADANEYKKIVQPELHRILTMARPVQVSHTRYSKSHFSTSLTKPVGDTDGNVGTGFRCVFLTLSSTKNNMNF